MILLPTAPTKKSKRIIGSTETKFEYLQVPVIKQKSQILEEQCNLAFEKRVFACIFSQLCQNLFQIPESFKTKRQKGNRKNPMKNQFSKAKWQGGVLGYMTGFIPLLCLDRQIKIIHGHKDENAFSLIMPLCSSRMTNSATLILHSFSPKLL